jgi:hypothetical protein
MNAQLPWWNGRLSSICSYGVCRTSCQEKLKLLCCPRSCSSWQYFCCALRYAVRVKDIISRSLSSFWWVSLQVLRWSHQWRATTGELFNDTSWTSQALQRPVVGWFQIINMKESGHGVLLSAWPGEIGGKLRGYLGQVWQACGGIWNCKITFNTFPNKVDIELRRNFKKTYQLFGYEDVLHFVKMFWKYWYPKPRLAIAFLIFFQL